MFLDKNFQNLFSSLAITSLSLLDLMFLFPINLIDVIFVLSPLLISNNKSTDLSSMVFILDLTSAEL